MDRPLPPYVLGRAVRTTNLAEADPDEARLGALWQEVTGDADLLGHPARIDDALYAVLGEYASDEHGAYTQVVGIGVRDGAASVPGGVVVAVPDEARRAYPASGEMPAALIAAWGRVWDDTAAGRLVRAFTVDVEVHEPGGAATILVAARD